MYNKNIMGIASGTEYSQFIAKEIITSKSIQKTLDSNVSLSNKKARLIVLLEGYQDVYEQTIHETNLESRKRKNTTQWVPSDINNKLRHLGGTSDQGKVEKMQQKACSKGK